MKIDTLKLHLVIITVLIILTIIWVLLSFWLEFSCIKINWFSRSGAMFVLASIWSCLLTRPSAEQSASPDYVNIYNHAANNVALKDEHYSAKYSIPKKLLYIELALSLFGTLIWAYGDLLLPLCS